MSSGHGMTYGDKTWRGRQARELFGSEEENKKMRKDKVLL